MILKFEKLFENEIFHSPGYWMLGNAEERYEQTQKFINGLVEYPAYSYPRLMAYRKNNYEKYKNDLQRVKELQDLIIAARSSPSTLSNELLNLYQEKIDFISNELSLLRAAVDLVGTDVEEHQKDAYAQANKNLYGSFDTALFEQIYSNKSVFDDKYAQTIEKCRQHSILKFTGLASLVDNYGTTKFLLANDIVAVSNAYLEQEGLSRVGWRTVVSDKTTAVSVSYQDKAFILPSKIRRSKKRVKQLLVHEIETHIRRFENAKQHDHLILKKGTLKGTFLEEGVGIFSEVMVDTGKLSENSGFKRAVHRYVALGIALGLDGESRTSVRQVFDDLLIYKYGTVDVSERRLKDTYTVIENIYRGSNFSDSSVVFWRAKIYLEGFMRVLNYYHNSNANKESLEDLYAARYDISSDRERNLVLDISEGLDKETIE